MNENWLHYASNFSVARAKYSSSTHVNNDAIADGKHRRWHGTLAIRDTKGHSKENDITSNFTIDHVHKKATSGLTHFWTFKI